MSGNFRELTSTVGRIVQAVLPGGSRFVANDSQDVADSRAPWKTAPIFAPDMFAVAGYLCRLGGVTAYFEPSPYRIPDGDMHFALNDADREEADEAAQDWRENWSRGMPQLVIDLWDQVIACWDDKVDPGHYIDDARSPAPWWKPAMMLTMIADMACDRVLREKVDGIGESPFEAWILTAYDVAQAKAEREEKEFRPPASLTLLVDTSLVCVLPKMRISPVGATLRNVSRNLALLPGRGEVRCYWSNLGRNAMPSENDETLDILLIPEPREMNVRWFNPEPHPDNIPDAKRREDKYNWDNFHLSQSWIAHSRERKAFVRSCMLLLRKAKRQTQRVNAVVLPEYAVDYEVFEELCDRLKRMEPGLEFIVAGSSSNCHDENGNHVVTRVWSDVNDPSVYETKSRLKHHRWRLDRSQVETYALSTALNPLIGNWWESTPLGRRELHFVRFRKASAFSVLICEELARSDPCHEILRAVAPNLIIALLLDGPQIKTRWPAQYAANLADDPGSSVLTFTSYGLIDRSNRQGKYPKNQNIALWKDDGGNFVEIQMPDGKGPRGVLLSLWPKKVRDITILGKLSEERAWRYGGHYPISID